MSKSDEEVTVTAVTIDKDEILSNSAYNVKVTISARVGKITDVKREFFTFKNDLFAQVVGGVIAACCGLCYGLIFCLAIPLAMIAVGSIYLDQCPAEYLIPIYLIIAGVFSFISSYVKYVLDGDNGCFECFLFCWFIAGCVWVFKLQEPSHNPEDGTNYCNHFLYTFAYWILMLPFLELVVLILLFFVFLCFQAVANYPI